MATHHAFLTATGYSTHNSWPSNYYREIIIKCGNSTKVGEKANITAIHRMT